MGKLSVEDIFSFPLQSKAVLIHVFNEIVSHRAKTPYNANVMAPQRIPRVHLSLPVCKTALFAKDGLT